MQICPKRTRSIADDVAVGDADAALAGHEPQNTPVREPALAERLHRYYGVGCPATERTRSGRPNDTY